MEQVAVKTSLEMEVSDFKLLTELEQREYCQMTGFDPLKRRDDSSLVSNGFFYGTSGNIHRFPTELRSKLISETKEFLSAERLHIEGLRETTKTGNDSVLKNAEGRLALYTRFLKFVQEKFAVIIFCAIFAQGLAA